MSLSRRSFLATGATVSTAALLAACGSASSSASGRASSSTSTLTVEHAYGTTTVPANVSRVATVAWGNQDVVLALGVLPVGMAASTFGVEDDSGMLEWTKAKVDELVAAGGETPVLFDETDGFDFEAVAATKPEIILAAYSGMTQEDYDTLAKIAPTIAFKGTAWSTGWREMTTMDGTGTGAGKQEAAAALVTDVEAVIADAVAKHPQLAGKAAGFFYATPTDMSSIGFYIPADPRAGYLKDLGLTVPASIQAAADADPSLFYVTVAAENIDTLSDVELMVMYADESELAALQGDALLGTMPAIKNGAVAYIGNGTPLSAAATPTPLAIPWGIEEYTSRIAAAADKVA